MVGLSQNESNNAGCSIIPVAMLLVVASILVESTDVKTVLGVLGVVLLIIGAFRSPIRWRCPYCDRFLPRGSMFVSYCPYCGKHMGES